MKLVSRIAAPLVLMLGVLAAAALVPAAPAGAAKRYVCPPCGASCDTLHFAAPGQCPQCGMALVEEGSAAATPDPMRKKVAILIFDGVEIIDYTGPYEMFGAANCDVYTVAETRTPVTTSMGMTVVPKFAFADAPQPDVLVVPGGGVKAASNSATTLAWVTGVTAHATHTLSVCNGAFILASAGLLDGLTATTTAGNIERLAKAFPKTRVVRDQRVVDNGKIITAGGLSAGIDGALHVIEKLFGPGAAQQTALGEEYDWQRGAAFTRAALADQEIPNVDLSSVGRWDVARTEGTTTHWELAVRGASDLGAAELADHIAAALEAEGHWVPAHAKNGAASGSTVRAWTFTGRDGKPWNGTLDLAGVPGEPHHYLGTVVVSRTP